MHVGIDFDDEGHSVRTRETKRLACSRKWKETHAAVRSTKKEEYVRIRKFTGQFSYPALFDRAGCPVG